MRWLVVLVVLAACGRLRFDEHDPADAGTTTGCRLGFPGPPWLHAPGPSRSTGTGDFNGDGIADLVTTHAGGEVAIYLGIGTGDFAAAIITPLDANAQQPAIGDLDGDGKLDLAVPLATDLLAVLYGNGDGTFQPRIDYPTGSGPYVALAGDFDATPGVDLAVLDTGAPAIRVFRNAGNRTFNLGSDLTTSPDSLDIASGDFNGDGHDDLVAMSTTMMVATLVLQDGVGGFTAPQSLGTASPGYGIAAADLDHDGAVDIVYTDPTNRAVEVMRGTGTGTFSADVRYATDAFPRAVVLRDVDGDGFLDAVVPCSNAGVIDVLPGRPGAAFGTATLQLSGLILPASAAVADFDRDGALDVAGSADADLVALYFRVGSGRPVLPDAIVTTTNPNTVLIRDLDGDGTLDLFTQGAGSQQMVAQHGNGDGTFGAPMSYPLGGIPTDLVAANLDGKNSFDLLSTRSADDFSVYTSDGLGGFSQRVDVVAGTTINYITAADLDGDGLDDVVITDGRTVGMLRNTGATFAVPKTFTFASQLEGVAVVDVDGDGDLDILAGELDGIAHVVINDGGFSFPVAVDLSTGLEPYKLVTGDFDRDGVIDIAFGSNTTTSTIGVLHGLGGGAFAPRVDMPVGIDLTSLATADVDNDGILDLIFTRAFANTVGVLRGHGDATFDAPVEFFAGIRPFDLAIGDIDRDGRLDLVTANNDPPNPIVSLMRGTCR